MISYTKYQETLETIKQLKKDGSVCKLNRCPENCCIYSIVENGCENCGHLIKVSKILNIEL